MKALINIRSVLLAAVAGCALPLAAQDAYEVADLPFTISEHVMVMDAQNDRLILFGGFQNGVLSNRVLAYSMDEGTWRELTPKGTAPTPRREAAAAYDSKRNRLIVFGGGSASGNTNDIFALSLNPDGEFWTELGVDPDGARPSPRTQASLVYDQLNDRVILYSGYASSATLHDVWAFNLNERDSNWGKGALPTVNIPGGTSVGNAAIYDPIGQRMLVYRGHTGGLHSLTLDGGLVWSNLTDASTPSARRYPAVAYDPIRHAMILQGGFLGGTSATNETFRLDLNDMNWNQLPSEDDSNGRFWHTGAYDLKRDRLVVVGGRDGARVADNTMAFLLGEIGTATPVTPGDFEVLKGEVVILAWVPAIGAQRYEVEIQRYDRVGTYSDATVAEISGNTALVALPQFAEQGTDAEYYYMWRVRGCNDHSSGEFSEYCHFVNFVPAAEADEPGEEVKQPELGVVGSNVALDGAVSADAAVDGRLEVVTDSATGLSFLEARSIDSVETGQDEAAGCAGGNAGNGLALSLLALLALAAGLRIKRKVLRA